jgi:hypothetical protein
MEIEEVVLMNPKQLYEEIEQFLSKHFPHPDDRDDLFVSELYDLLREES